MDYLKCTGVLERDGGEIRDLKLLAMPHVGELICHQTDQGLSHYEIIAIEHCSGGDAPFPYVHLQLRPRASGLA